VSGHARERAAWFVAALAGVTLAMAPAGALPGPLAALVLTLTLGIVPGSLLVRTLAPGEASDARAAMALLLSPCLSGVSMTLLRLASVGAAPAARALALALALFSAWEALRPRRRDAAAASDRGVWVLALSVGAALVLAHVLLPALSARSDGSFHAGVVWAAARALPPEDPFFAGLTLRYFWGLHAWAATWVVLAPGLGAYTPLVVTSALAAVCALLAVGVLARSLGASPRTRLLAQVLALVGTTPFAWLVLAARATSGEVRGSAELARSLAHGADEALRSLDPGLLHPSLVLPLDKFVVLTPFAWGLAGAAVMALAISRAFGGRGAEGWRAYLGLALVVATVLFAHPVAGLALAAAALGGAAWAAFSIPEARRALPGIALALGCGLAVMAPYLHALANVATPGSTGSSGATLAWGLTLDTRGLVSALLAGAFLLPPLLWPGGAPNGREPGRLAVAGMLVALVVPACLLRLPGDNQSKFLNLAFLLASAPTSLVWARASRTPARRPAVVALLTVALAPTLAAMLWAYAHESGSSADAPSRPPGGIVSAVRQLVPARAVLVDATQDTTRGAAPALPGETGHALLWSGGFMARKWGYGEEPLRLHRAAAEALARGQWPPADGGRWLRALNPDLWMILPDDTTRAATFEERVVARADGVRLVAVSGLL
jgi:hypothetical protein